MPSTNPSLIHDIRNSYNLRREDVEKYKVAVHVLSCYAMVWPNVEELTKCANKIQLAGNLEVVASEENTNCKRPKMVLLTSEEDQEGHRQHRSFPNPIPDHFVVKRTHSETGHHVLLPDMDDDSKQARLREPVDIAEARWFLQSASSLLKEAGEIRIFFVGLKIIYKVHTKWRETRSEYEESEHDSWAIKFVENVTPLDVVM
jgi:hypothetical protein